MIKRDRSLYRSVMFVYISMHANECVPLLLIRLNIECITFLIHIYIHSYIIIPFTQNENKMHSKKRSSYMKHCMPPLPIIVFNLLSYPVLLIVFFLKLEFSSGCLVSDGGFLLSHCLPPFHPVLRQHLHQSHT